MPKRSFRDQFLRRRKSCSGEFCCSSSLKVQQRLLNSESFRQSRTLSLYSTVHNEVFTEVVAQAALQSGKRLIYPRVKGNELEFVAVAGMSELAAGSFGVLEPVGTEVVSAKEIDLVVVPGVVFDLAGHRLGYGRGYYDRILAALPSGTGKVGFAYEFQVVESLPVDAHDQALSMLMTERRTISFCS